jgi:hypothetical protein
MLKILVLPLLLSYYSGHVTMTSINHVHGTDSLKMTVRIDYGSFLRDYQQSILDDIDFEILSSYNPFPSDLANNYINSKIAIYINNKRILGKLLKTGMADGDIYFEILYRIGHKIKNLTVRNTLLTGLYTDAENLTIIKINNIEKGIRFTHGYTEELVILK